MSITLRADVFPTTLTLTDSTGEQLVFDRARVIITAAEPNQILVYKDAANGPEVVYSAVALDFEAPRTPQRLREAFAPRFTNYTLSTGDGSSITFVKSGGCGCGSRLKSFNPFPTINALSAS